MESERISRIGSIKHDWDTELRLFGQLIVDSVNSKNQIAQLVKNAQMQDKPVRFNLWRMFLGIVDTDGSWQSKQEQLIKARNKYGELLSKYTEHSTSTTETGVKKNPLGALLKAAPANTASTTKDSLTIQKDIKAQLQSVDIQIGLITKDKARTLMTRILFIWDKLQPQLDAKNWKYQILSNIVYVYGQSAIASTDCLKDTTASNDLKDMYLQANSIEHAQADIFSVFSAIMEKHKQMFKLQADLGKAGINPNSRNHNALLQRISHVWEIQLKSVDIDLFRHLQMLQFNPRPVLSKWIKPLLCRQFDFSQLMSIWDNILLQSLVNNKPIFQHLDYTCLAMVIYLRDIIMNKESAYEMTQILVKFPTVTGIYLQELINLSWMIRDLYLEELGRKQSMEERRNSGIGSGRDSGTGSRKSSEEVFSKIEEKQPQRAEKSDKPQKPTAQNSVDKPTPETKIDPPKPEQPRVPQQPKQPPKQPTPVGVLQRLRKTIQNKNTEVAKPDKPKPQTLPKQDQKPKQISLQDPPKPPEPSKPPQQPLFTLKPDQLKQIHSLLSQSIKLSEDIDLKAKLLKLQSILNKH